MKHPSDGDRVVSFWSHVRTWWRLVVSVGDGDGATMVMVMVMVMVSVGDGDGAAITIGGQEGRNPEKKRWLPVARGERQRRERRRSSHLPELFTLSTCRRCPKQPPSMTIDR